MLHLTLVFRTAQKESYTPYPSPHPLPHTGQLARHCFAVKRQHKEGGGEGGVGEVGAAKVRIHKLSNTYNGHGPEASSRVRIQIQHSALTVNTHTHIEYSHK